jgi:dTDP-4-dehydrorhamnose 3,5-epimerase-like enzyme
MVTFQEHGDERGMLVALEYEKECPFSIKRVYYMYGTKKNVRRGYHAHRNLQQLLICINGSCKIHLDDGEETKEIVLDTPQKGLFLGNGIWREMYEFTPDAVLMSLASELYDESDYIRDYQQFIEEKKRGL